MRILITEQDIQNTYIQSLIEAYKTAGCEVVFGPVDFYLSNYIPDILHIQWPETLYRGDYSLLGNTYDAISERIKWYKKNGSSIVYTVHNIEPHESNNREFDLKLYTLIIENSDLIIHHGPKSIELMREKYPIITSKKNIICNHGDYRIQIINNISKEKAREVLSLPKDKFILLYFGSIRPYKGFEFLKNIFKKWNIKDKYLLVAGRYIYNTKNVKQLMYYLLKTKIRKKGNNWRFDFRMIKNSEVEAYFSAADGVILTHKIGLTSGIIAMAATFKVPVVYPNIGNFAYQMKNWEGKSYRVNDINEALNALSFIYNKYYKKNRKLKNNKWLDENNWLKHVNKIIMEFENI